MKTLAEKIEKARDMGITPRTITRRLAACRCIICNWHTDTLNRCAQCDKEAK